MPAVIIEYQQTTSGDWKAFPDLSLCNGVPLRVLRDSLRDVTEAFEDECECVVIQEKWRRWTKGHLN